MENLEELKKDLVKRLKEREKLSALIRDLRYEIDYIEKKRPDHRERDITQSKAYKMFGKQYKDLTAEELKQYNYVAQKKHRNIGKDNKENE